MENQTKYLLEKADELANDIYNSELYQKYKASEKIIESSPELRDRIDEYKAQHTAYQKEAESGLPNFDREKFVSGLYWGLMLNEDAKRFLSLEKELASLITGIISAIISKCEIGRE